MHDTSDTVNAGRPVRLVEMAMVALLLLTGFGLTLSGAWNKSPAVDEVSHLTAGVSYWRTGDFRLNSEQGKFPQAWAALPVAFGPFKFPSLDQVAWWRSDEWTLGHQFLFGIGNDAQSMLRRGRAMVALLGVILGLVVYLWSRRLFGVAGGLVSLVACVFSPALLAHGGLTTSDMALAMSLTLATGAWWAVLHRVSPGTVLGSAAATALVFVTKASAFVLIPILLALLVVRIAAGRPLSVCMGRSASVAARWRQGLVLGGVGLVHLAVVVLVIWACFGFRYSPFKQAEPGRDRYGESWEELLAKPSAATELIVWAKTHRVLPDGYLWGIAEAHVNAEHRRAFLAGRYSLEGWWYFFPFCVLVKTPLYFFGLLALALGAAIRRSRRSPLETGISCGWHGVYELVPLLTLLAVYGVVLLMTRLNVGHRHALALYPPMLILAGGAGWWFTDAGTARRLGGAVTGLLLILAPVVAFRTWPNYLAYFNPAAGGPAHGYQLLVDSSLDWGQELPALRRWLDRHEKESSAAPVYLSYFGVGSPAYYGVNAVPLPNYAIDDPSRFAELKAGIYCISATMLQAVYLTPMGKWCRQYEEDYQAGLNELRDHPESFRASSSPETAREKLRLLEELQFARLAAFLRHRKPDDHVNHAILIYRLSEKDLEAALHGVPAELHATNEVKR